MYSKKYYFYMFAHYIYGETMSGPMKDVEERILITDVEGTLSQVRGPIGGV
jgi:hypothetical protein